MRYDLELAPRLAASLEGDDKDSERGMVDQRTLDEDTSCYRKTIVGALPTEGTSCQNRFVTKGALPDYKAHGSERRGFDPSRLLRSLVLVDLAVARIRSISPRALN